MISNEERREAAQKLREIEWRAMPELTDGELIDLLARTVGFNRYTNGDFDEGLLGRIADLIDRPTCTVESVIYRDECEEYEVRLSCGHEVTTTGSADDLAFCHYCGAEVVKGE